MHSSALGAAALMVHQPSQPFVAPRGLVRYVETIADAAEGVPLVLYLRNDRIGDMIVSTGLLRAIHAKHPRLALDVLASPINASVIAHEPAVHEVVVFDRRRAASWWALWRHLRRTRYDVVIDPMVFTQSLTTLLLMLATGARWRVGVPKAHLPEAYALRASAADPRAHHVEHLAQLAAPFGVAPEAARQLALVLSDAERTEAIEAWGPGSCLLQQRCCRAPRI